MCLDSSSSLPRRFSKSPLASSVRPLLAVPAIKSGKFFILNIFFYIWKNTTLSVSLRPREEVFNLPHPNIGRPLEFVEATLQARHEHTQILRSGEMLPNLHRCASTRSPCFVMFFCASYEGLLRYIVGSCSIHGEDKYQHELLDAFNVARMPFWDAVLGLRD